MRGSDVVELSLMLLGCVVLVSIVLAVKKWVRFRKLNPKPTQYSPPTFEYLMAGPITDVYDFNSTQWTRIDRAKCGPYTLEIYQSSQGHMFSTNLVWILLPLLVLARQLMCNSRLRKKSNEQEAAFYVMTHPRRSALKDLPSSSKYAIDEEGRFGRAVVRIRFCGVSNDPKKTLRWWGVWISFPPVWWEKLLALPRVTGAEYSFSETRETGQDGLTEEGDSRAKSLFDFAYSYSSRANKRQS